MCNNVITTCELALKFHSSSSSALAYTQRQRHNKIHAKEGARNGSNTHRTHIARKHNGGVKGTRGRQSVNYRRQETSPSVRFGRFPSSFTQQFRFQ